MKAHRDEDTEPLETIEPWVLPLIVLGLIGLSGSLLLLVPAVVVALALWGFTTPAPPTSRKEHLPPDGSGWYGG
jgi:hypothetical protein